MTNKSHKTVSYFGRIGGKIIIIVSIESNFLAIVKRFLKYLSTDNYPELDIITFILYCLIACLVLQLVEILKNLDIKY
jgi:hypothetical protein